MLILTVLFKRHTVEKTGTLKNERKKKLGNSILDDQLDKSGDLIINKILFYLSRLPIQFSIFELTERISELIEFSRFKDYVDQLFDMTDQMRDIQVIKTNLPNK